VGAIVGAALTATVGIGWSLAASSVFVVIQPVLTPLTLSLREYRG